MMSPRSFVIAFSVIAQLSTAFQPRIFSSLASASVTRRSSSTSISMDSGLTLYGSQQTRSPLVNWYLEEKSIPYTQKAPRPSGHPFGQTPFLTDTGGVEVFESGAILLYIADAYGGEKHHLYSKKLWSRVDGTQSFAPLGSVLMAFLIRSFFLWFRDFLLFAHRVCEWSTHAHIFEE